jgi:hypothetical protein
MMNATTAFGGINRPTSETTGQTMCVQTGDMQHTGNMVGTDPLLGETGLVDKKRKREGEDLRPLNKRKRQDLPIQLFMSGPEHEDVLSTHFGHQGFFGQNIDRDLSCLVENSTEAIKLYTSLAKRLSEQRFHIKCLEDEIIGRTNLGEGWDDALPDEERHNVCRACPQTLTMPQKQGARMCRHCFIAYSVPLTKAQYDVNRELYGVWYNDHTHTYWVPTVSLTEGNPAREAILLEAEGSIEHWSDCLRSKRAHVAHIKSDIGKLLAAKKLARTEHAYTTVHFDKVGDVNTRTIQKVLN